MWYSITFLLIDRIMIKSLTDLSAENYCKTSSHQQQKVFLELLSPIEINPGFKCLDIGCGSGNNTALLAQWVGNHGNVIGIDPDAKRISVAQKTFGGIDNITFVVGKSTAFPLLQEGYDIIVANCVMHWMPPAEKMETYIKIFSALKPGGIFASTELFKWVSDTARFLKFTSKAVQDEATVFCQSAENNKEIFSNLGFEILNIEEVEHRNTLESLDFYFKWLDSSLQGKIDSRKIYSEHKGEIHLQVNADGSVVHELDINKIIVRKPIHQ